MPHERPAVYHAQLPAAEDAEGRVKRTPTSGEKREPRIRDRSMAATHGSTAWLQAPEMLTNGYQHSLRDEAIEVIESGIKTVIVDFFGCAYIDSAGLGTLVSIQRQCLASGGIFRLQNLDENLALLLQLTALDKLFDLTPSREYKEKCGIVVPTFEQIDRELVEYFARNPERLTDLDWRKFELLLDAVFKNNGFRTELGCGRADGGIDLRLVQSDACGELITLVQAKKYDKHRPIRLEAVQAFCAVIDDQKANRGLFVTTSRYLPGVHTFAERQRHRLALADSADVARWCEGAVRRMIEAQVP